VGLGGLDKALRHYQRYFVHEEENPVGAMPSQYVVGGQDNRTKALTPPLHRRTPLLVINVRPDAEGLLL